MILLNYIPLIIIALVFSIVMHLYLRLYFAVNSRLAALTLLVIFPHFLFSMPRRIIPQIMNDREKIIKSNKLSKEEEEKMRRILSSKFRIYKIIVKNLVPLVKAVTNIYVGSSAKYIKRKRNSEVKNIIEQKQTKIYESFYKNLTDGKIERLV
ncbi:hypothetical protein CN982_18525 [Bacillus cereus]|uniref:hypothetical protein n=1 Tax=Bacillus cereus TaxID=1396 RepID=UPI000BFD5EA1|nr:hypothetical protein [Bacillus cereus]PGO26328.1 hypothetical protein CN982_18525 [Bacillus cereus]